MSILTGIDELVDGWLGVEPTGKRPYYQHRTAANELTRRDEPITGTVAFLEASYDRIHANWLAAIDAGYSKPSKKNWRWKRHLSLSSKNRRPEAKLECAIVSACGENWSNQMPTASGLTGPHAYRSAAVDLVLRKDSTAYSLIELKVESNTPLFAAIEIMKYGLLLVWSKNNQEALGYNQKLQPILGARTVTLGTLAPGDYYSSFDLTNLASALNDGLAELGKRHRLNLSFEFCQLGASYTAGPGAKGVRLAVEERQQICSGM